MELNGYDPISTIDTTTYDWKCRVRVQSFWKGLNVQTNEFWGINMVLIDDSNSRIHAFANANYCDELLKLIKEGEVYMISNFKVKEYLGDEKFRPVQNKRHIFFTPHTQFKTAGTAGPQIEKYAFDLFHYSEIEKLADDHRFLIDMVGKVQNIQDIIKSTKNDKEKTRFKFDIANGRSIVPVTFFDLFGEQLQLQFSKLDPDNIYVIISSARVNRYEGIAHLSNYPATRVFINPEHYSIDQLKKSWNEVIKEPALVNIQQDEGNVGIEKKFMKLKEITNLSKDFDEETIYCEVTVKRINDKSSWYFRKCTGCDLELDCVEGKFKCLRKNGCGRIIPYPDKRFRLCTLCSDETGSVAIIFPDIEITRLIGKTVIDLQAECTDEADEDKFPGILNSLIKQKFTISLFITEDNIQKGSTVFNAKEVLQAQEKVDTTDPNVATVVEMGDVSMAAETDGNVNQTPNTGNSTNIKTRARKITEAVVFPPTESTGMQPLKNIKREKDSK